MHEIDNPFDLFTIAIKKTTRETIGHLPMENLKVNVSNGPWSKVYRCSHFFTILCLAISSKWTWNPLKSWSLPATNPKNNELVIELVILSNCKFIPAFKVLWLVHFSKCQQKYPHHLLLTNPRKKTSEKKNWRKIW